MVSTLPLAIPEHVRLHLYMYVCHNDNFAFTGTGYNIITTRHNISANGKLLLLEHCTYTGKYMLLTNVSVHTSEIW